MNTFSDIFKKSFLEGFSGGNITTGRVLITLAVTSALALYIFLVYYLSSRKTFYNKSFNIALALIAVITASIILAMQSNLVISLGMVGALSIVRFRTAVKDPMDLVFLFWSISVGIICGANLYAVALLSSLVLTVGLFLLELSPAGIAASLLVVSGSEDCREEEILELVRETSRLCKVASRNLTQSGLQLIVECKPREEAALIQKVKKTKGVHGVSLMAHNGEVTV